MSRFKYALVKFAHAFPYGEDHDNFIRVAQSVTNFSDIIVINLEIKDYGEKDSYELAQRYKISEKEYPALRLFKDGVLENPIIYKDPDEDKNTDKIELIDNNIKLFLRAETGFPVLLDNCSREMDEIAESFVRSSKTEEREQLVKKAKELVKLMKNKNKKKWSNVYVKLMEKGIERGNQFFDSENARVKTLLKGKLTDEKKADLKARLNILQSFLTQKIIKDEL